MTVHPVAGAWHLRGTGPNVEESGFTSRCALAALLLHANIPVSAGELAEMVWDGSPLADPAATLMIYSPAINNAHRRSGCGSRYWGRWW